ncbi:helix-turn-helix transcriptional regulator, partial [Rhizobiaceae sp. 2RAB30]
MAALSKQALSDLIGAIYDCTLDPGRWEETLSLIACSLQCERAVLSLNDLRTDRLLIDKHVGWEPEWLDERAKHLPEIHGKLSEWFTHVPSLDRPFVASRELSAAEFLHSPYAQNCLVPLDLVDVVHFCLIRTTTNFSELVLWRKHRQGIIGDREIELGCLLTPHLRRAVTISNVLDIRTVERNRMAEALDALRHGVFLTDERGAILHANRSAEAMLRDNGPIKASGGVLAARSLPANSELRKAIVLAAEDEAAIGKAGVAIRLTEEDQPPVFAHVLPLTGGEARSRLKPDAVAAVFVDARPDGHDRAALVASAFGLTPAEMRVVASLLAGRTLAETGDELGIAFTTARTHLSRIFLKTGVSRQADLVRLAMQTVAPRDHRDAADRPPA